MKIIRPVTIGDAALVDSAIVENDHAAYNAGTTYALGDRVISTTTHRIYESLQGSNVGHALPASPEIETDWWLDVGATNRWRMFDGGVDTQSSRANEIAVDLEPGLVDALALLNIEADSYRVVLDVDDVGVVYDTGTVSLVLGDSIGDWYQYFFEEIRRKSDVVLTDIPPYGDAVLTVTLTASGGTVNIGSLIVGLKRDLGDMLWRPRIGIVDYSVKSVDAFGNSMVVERPYAKRMSAEVVVRNAVLDEVARVLAQFRATAVVWVGTELFTSTIIFGFYRSFEVVIDYDSRSLCNLELEGLK